MEIHGIVQNGVVVPERGAKLPEGAPVIISYRELTPPKPAGPQERVQVPLVPSDFPGSVRLTGQQNR